MLLGQVLNLVINGMPSIQSRSFVIIQCIQHSFKPCYKWNAFNTIEWAEENGINAMVLNLVINGMPSIPYV